MIKQFFVQRSRFRCIRTSLCEFERLATYVGRGHIFLSVATKPRNIEVGSFQAWILYAVLNGWRFEGVWVSLK